MSPTQKSATVQTIIAANSPAAAEMNSHSRTTADAQNSPQKRERTLR